MRRGLLGALLLVASALGAAWASSRIETQRGSADAGAQVLYLPSGEYLKAISLGYPEVLADAVYIWSIQYYGHYERADRFRYLEHVYANVIAELDPRYIDPYLIGAMIMSVEANDAEMALRLLDKGIAANPEEWILPFDAGFLCYDRLHDYPRAARYFETALRMPQVPGAVRRLHAEMYNKMGDKRASLEYWSEVAREADSDYVRNVSSMHVHDLKIEVDLETLRAAVAAWRLRDGSLPPDLQALARARLIATLPFDPEGAAYLYDPRTGAVSCASRFRLRRSAGS